ncbi:hypothetical protein J8I29_13945 [Labrys sp. LIt4]|uniref:hypothetical protein n=1 Tax=Labrys sp. LIt4 TaxID=2821355 RepID=UPI001ADF5FC6|nr:hypothetical protein [Labrys sp. LIt4]MBP0580421.1 hypothetical protein [Labrys sp. LIt4]
MAHPSSTMPSRYIAPLKGFCGPNELIQRNIVELDTGGTSGAAKKKAAREDLAGNHRRLRRPRHFAKKVCEACRTRSSPSCFEQFFLKDHACLSL